MVRREILTLKRSNNRKENDMGAGGIIQKHAAVLLVAVTDSSVYDGLSTSDKSTVNGIDAKDPLNRTQEDVDTLYDILGTVKGC